MVEFLVFLFLVMVFFLIIWSLWIRGGSHRLVKSIAAFMIIVVLVGVASFYLSKSRTFQLFGHLLYEGQTDDRVIALTFDDGPFIDTTDEVLSILERQDIVATFFLNGSNMVEYPEETMAIIDAGHELGNHSYSHPRMLLMSYDTIAEEMEKTDDVMRSMGYTPTGYVRSPYCKKLIVFPWYLNRTNQINVTWSIEPETNHKDVEGIYKNIMNEVEPGAIILLHSLPKNRNSTRDVLEEVIISLKKEGYKFVTITEMFEMDG